MILFVFLLSSIPDFISVRQGELYFDFVQPIKQITGYFETLKNGEIFNYQIGHSKRSFLRVFPNYFKTSFFYLIISLLISLIIGVTSGLILSGNKSVRIRNTLSLIGHIPDFILILLLQLAVISFNNFINVKLFRIASAGDNYALLLPFFTLSLYPAIYLMRIISIQTYFIRGTNYILYAKAKGLTKNVIFYRHILPGVIPVVLAEIPRLTSLLLTNLFIAERLYNIPGVTRFLFYILGQNSKPSSYEYQFFQGHVVVNTLFGFLLLYMLCYLTLLIIIKIFKKVNYND